LRYEIINPSDKCFLQADSDIVASAAAIILGSGAYGLRDDKDRPLPSMFLFGDNPNAVWKKHFGITFAEYLDMPGALLSIANCLATFTYAGKRSSLNNIGAKAAALEELVRNRALERIL
jgi:hypothetical protein